MCLLVQQINNLTGGENNYIMASSEKNMVYLRVAHK